ncbi:3-isopropylmalate dehydratase small subunit [Pseudoduganella namucuonensis]|uniref:3-isopropylmalate dehydratase small subunit n=1 Tax=Pseudoduganella namucuonensis TaxID=1035707 RepID=A0A1I7LDZ1_9BURK|nr:3-isopropylmalate dehydratase small subunit [Pseudoduganella namucuonensis]SFV07925.1 3-isopropylmalate/(R)-2-methylmalate dehydratase small subunit [Pseudoduganella namucuonensis]
MSPPFTRLHAVAAPLDRANVDTDAILPARFMKTVKRGGLGSALFDAWRRGAGGAPNPDFVLNRPAYAASRILVANDNFGCGSSREHAVWALADAGIRCVIAPSFGEIFAANCLKNGVLPVALPPAVVAILLALLAAVPGAELTVDLEAQHVLTPGGQRHAFHIDPYAKHCLLLGLDDIAVTLERAEAITSYEQARRARTPWLFEDIRAT